MNTTENNFTDSNAANYTILIVDDNATNLRVLSDYLTDYGFTTLVATDGELALKRAEYAQPNIILLDILMPGMDGFEVCRRLKAVETTQNIPVIFTDALTETEDKIKGFQVGAVDYITKPFHKEEVLVRVTTHLQLKELTERLEQKVQERTGELAKTNHQLQQEIAERKQAEERIEHLNLVLRAIRNVNQLIVREKDPHRLIEQACRLLTETRGYHHAWIALVDQAQAVTTVVNTGLDRVFAPMREHLQQGQPTPCMQQALARSGAIITKNTLTGCPDCPLASHYQDHGAISTRLEHEGTIYGLLTVAVPDSYIDDVEEQKLFEEAAADISLALHGINLEEQHRQLEDQLRQSQKMEAIGRLAGGMAHDFNNLLTVITGYSELVLHRHLDENDPQYRDIEQIRKASERASILTRQLLAFSRQQVMEREVLDLNTIITDMHKMLRRLVSEDIELAANLDPTLRPIEADPGQIEQIIMNLVVNASDAMPQGGQLTTKTTNIDVDQAYADRHIGLRPGLYTILTVSDTGIGMDAETQAQIFEPFFTTKEKGKGTGLGLATVYGIVQQIQGYIELSSRPEQGTTFQIYLPCFEQDVQLIDQKPTPADESLQGTETILLVEDEDMVRELTRRTLVQNGYNVLEARHGQEALIVYEQCEDPIHLLLTDVVMPGGLSGPDLAEQLTPVNPKIKVLYMSGYVEEAITQRGILNSDIAFLQKPFSPIDLSRKVREVLDAQAGSTPDRKTHR